MPRRWSVLLGLVGIIAVGLVVVISRPTVGRLAIRVVQRKAADGSRASSTAVPQKPGWVLLDGRLPGEIPADAPRSVRFGVIVIKYAGAEGAGRYVRSKSEALEYAVRVAHEARLDFAKAVALGDLGSLADAGRIPRGVLEPAPEYLLFVHSPGEVSGPVDTPGGYWIVKNLGL